MKKIRYLTRLEIDYKNWDQCIEAAYNGSIFGYSWFLNLICDDWHAIMEGDYEKVMPLIVKRKLGLEYIALPEFAYQFGIFSTSILKADTVKRFIEHIPPKFKYLKLSLNNFNKTERLNIPMDSFQVAELDLIRPYEKLKKNFTEKAIENSKRKEGENISISMEVTLNEFLKFYKRNNHYPNNKLNFFQLDILRIMLSNTIRYKLGGIIGAYNEKNQLMAAVFMMWSHNMLIFSASAINKEGLKKNVYYLLIDEILRLNTEKIITVKVEQNFNELPSTIMQEFGAQIYELPIVEINKLPWYMRFLSMFLN